MSLGALGCHWSYLTALCIDAALMPTKKKLDGYMHDDSTLSSPQTDTWIPLNSDLPYPVYAYVLSGITKMVVPNCIVLQMLSQISKEELGKFSTSIESYIDMLKYLNAFVLATHNYITMLYNKCTPLLLSVSPPTIFNLVSKSLVCSDLSVVVPSDMTYKFTIWYKEMMTFFLELSIWIKELTNAQSSFSPIIHSVTNYSCLKDVCKKQTIAYQLIQFIVDTEPIELWIKQIENFRESERAIRNSTGLNWHDQQKLIRRCVTELKSIVSIDFVEGSDKIDAIRINTDVSALFCSPQWSQDSDIRFKDIIRWLMENRQFFSNYKASLYDLSFLDELNRPETQSNSSAVPYLSADGQEMLEKIWGVYQMSYAIEKSLRNKDHFNACFYGVLEGLYAFDLNDILQNWIAADDVLSIYFTFKRRLENIQSYNAILNEIVYTVDSLASVRDKYICLNYDNGTERDTSCDSTSSSSSSSSSSSKDKKNVIQIRCCLEDMHKLLIKYLDFTGLEYTDALRHKYLQSCMLILLQMPKSSALALSDSDIVDNILRNINTFT